MALIITKAKPNPAGKDRVGRNLTLADQLAAEWVDIKNTGGTAVDLSSVELYHWAYPLLRQPEWELVTGFSGVLNAGQTVRVHSGNPISLTQMRVEDKSGAEHHVFTRKNYVWNNDKADHPLLWYKISRQELDRTSYDAPTQNGKVLMRIGSKLV